MDGVALRGDGEDLVDGVQVELGRLGDVSVRAARTGANTSVISLVILSHIGTTIPLLPQPYDGSSSEKWRSRCPER